MIEYPIFYRKFGIRRLEQLVKPLMQSVNTLFLPFNSAFHYIPEDDTSYGIGPENVILQKNKKPIQIQHVTELAPGADKGPPRPNPFIMNSAIQRYHQMFRRARPVKDLALADKDTRALLVINHALYPHRYRYMETNFFTPFNKWANNYKTLWTTVNNIANTTQRNQFIMLKVPKNLPPVSLLMRAEKELSRNLMETFNEYDELALLDIWKWLGENRENAIMNVLEPKNYDKVNFIWMEAGRWCALNLGALNGWIDIKQNESVSGNKIKPVMMQRRFLRLQMSILEAGTATGGEISEEVTDASETVDEKKSLDEAGTEIVDSEVARDVSGDVETTRELPVLPTEVDAEVTKLRVEKREALTAQGAVAKTSINKKMATSHDAEVANNDDNDTAVEETETVDQTTIDDDLEQLEKLHVPKQDTLVEYKSYEPAIDNLENGVIQKAETIAKKGLISPAEYRRFVKMAERYKEIPNPYKKDGKLADLTVIKPEEVIVQEKNPIAENIPGVMDTSMLNSSLKDFDKRYINDVLPKDIVSMVLNVQKAGVAVQNYDIQKNIDLHDEFETHVIKLAPVVGTPTTIRFRVPIINDDGTFKANGVKYRMRRQRGDLPIRKISPSEVALTSYYSKLFVMRSERAVFNYPNWLLNEITSRGIDPLDQTITNIRMANVFDHELDLPKIYSTIAQRFTGFSAGKYDLFFDYHKRIEYFGEKIVAEVESKNVKLIPVGRNGDDLLIMDWNSNIHAINIKKPTQGMRLIGDIEKLIGMDVANRPIEIAEVDVFSKAIPIGFVLGHEIGLGNLIKTIGSKVRRAGRREQYKLEDNEFAVKFQDEVLIFERSDKMACLIFGSFNRYHRDIKRYSVYHFDKREVYQMILENNGLGARYTREFDLMFKMWVDHITKEILIDMKEPTDLVKLLIRACEMLVTDQHPAAVDNRYMRDKGYERIAGMMYSELSKAMRVYNSKPANASATVDLNPEAVWNVIRADPTVSVIEESNPIHSLKEKEVVVYRGAGGRSSRSMTAPSRVFHRSSMGVVSEATPDNSEVGTIFYLSADPNYTSLRGTIRELDKTEGNAAKLVSTSMLLAPGAENDDAKRVNFISIQNSQTTHATGYTPLPTRTGYERVIAHRLDDLFVKTAEQDGTVESLANDVLTIRYKDGSVTTVEVGRRFGKIPKDLAPHEIVTDLKVGDKVKKGEVISFNKNYFAKDRLDPKQVILKPGVMATTALMETTDTLDDSCAISANFATKLQTTATHVRCIKLAFEQEIHNLLPIGSEVEVDSILCTIHNPSGGNKELFDEKTLETLKAISSLTPKAKNKGVIERIEVIYAGEPDDMSQTLRALTDVSDRVFVRKSKQLGKPPATGQVEAGFRVEGIPLDMDTAAIKVYITGPVEMGVGDKGVFGNQLKTIVGRVMTGTNETQDGKPIDAIFGYQSIANRIVLSPELTGTLNSLLIEIGKRAVKAYRGK